ncbi:hypothetical protein BMEII0805 [Brucella melitensis bv. 1 str. 16M]|uniref:Uncharacterized protein n=1 Tax=Brucella melitensis biotype 1 (strain ATCC 23456 / CCUG 17765 / NCTC 10094 / 16M) TaxID=224914 RepID=Q8YBT1_BRUME|nr:hypothetical protein BMEII0805 [Brucella melitensis bv. 1 str. 16M]EEW87300.1 predicted protein [Brucella melitensis bv. 1 str. 16M]EEZ10014.1 predicted protein [Brucella melitensis bv. 3 str. Ether]EEZ13139.1 predicted protein [Brucella melitensis bv. 1 str. Rev.1]
MPKSRKISICPINRPVNRLMRRAEILVQLKVEKRTPAALGGGVQRSGSVFGRRSKTERPQNRCDYTRLQGTILQGRYAFTNSLKKKPPRSDLSALGRYSLLQVE